MVTFGIVYKVTNVITGKIYVGQTIQPIEKRWRIHCSKWSGCKYLGNAIQKYGKENFKIEILAECGNQEDLDNEENSHIEMFGTIAPDGYNLRSGGSKGKFSQASRMKMSESAKGRPGFFKGKKLSQDHRAKLSISHEGKSLSTAHAQAIQAGSRKKSVICNETGKTYISISEASRDLGIEIGKISLVAKGKRKSAGGYTFSYV